MPQRSQISRSDVVLSATALAAFCWVAARAWYQSITIDEATTYLIFAGRTLDFAFFPANNNHLLNTILMWCATHLFGITHLTVRAPALLGAVVYIASVLVLVRRLPGGLVVRWPLLVGLVFNPLIGDYMVAARGYALATGFLMAGIACGVTGRIRSPRLRCALCSLCAGVSFLSNFAFAFAAAVMLAVVFVWWLRRGGSFVAMATWTVVPGAVLTAAVAGYTLSHWPAGELWFGSQSLVEMAHWLFEPSLTRPDLAVIGVWPYRALVAARPFLFPIAGMVLAFQMLWLVRRRPARDGAVDFALGVGAILLLTLAVHWIAFRAFGLLLPKERTGLFLMPLITLLAGSVAAISPRDRVGRAGRGALIVTLFVFAGFYMLCFRDSYFKEWRWNADMHSAYLRIRDLERNGCVKSVGPAWRYVASFNFYREMYGASDREELEDATKIQERRDVYILNPVFDQEFVQKNRLRVIFTGDSGELLLAVAPEVDSRGAGCIAAR